MSKTRSTVQVQETKVVQTRCDNCGKTEKGEPEDWVSVRTGHSDWGNDSIESGDEFDACSGECFIALLGKALEDYEPIQGEPTFYAYPGRLSYRFAKTLTEDRK